MHWSGGLLLLGYLLVTGCTTHLGQREPQLRVQAVPEDTTPSVGRFAQDGVMSDVQLQQELQAFADRYVQRMMQVADDALQQTDQPAERAALDLFKSSSGAAAISIATSPNPLHGLRDMRVLVSLQELVWRNGGPQAIAPARAQAIHRQLNIMEQQIRLLAQRVVPAAAMKELDQRIEAWHRENPDQKAVAFIRFQNLDLANTNLDENTASSGLLAPVAEAAREVHETRKLAERALFLANHMPMLMQWRAELLSDRVLAGLSQQGYLEEARQMRATLQQISQDREAFQQELELYRPLVRQLNDNIQLFPQRIGEERIALFDHMERSLESYGPALTQIGQITASARDATLGLERIVQQSNQQDSMNKQEIFAMLDKMLLLTKEANQIISELDGVARNQSGTNAVTALDQLLIEHERRIFAYAAALLVFLAGLLLGTRWLWLRMGKGT